MSGGPVLRM